MESPAAPAEAGDAADGGAKTERLPETIINISPEGDVVLDVVFETSKETLAATRKAARPEPPRRPGQPSSSSQPVLKPCVRVAYRVQLAVLRRQSKYFDRLLGDTRFSEARAVSAALQRLSTQGLSPAQASPDALPAVRIVEDDESMRAAGREAAFGDLLRVLHRRDVAAKPVAMGYVAVLAVLADRFDCAAALARYLNTGLKFRWPATALVRPGRGESDEEAASPLSRAAEETLRQKILIAWLLDQPVKLQAATRELVMLGSRKWGAFSQDEAPRRGTEGASWWHLQDDLERELQYRRECILNMIGSLQRHFLRLYASRVRQCKLGYDSSVSCDSYQLGEMVKFLASKDLLFLVDFSPASLDNVPEVGILDIDQLLATLRQCPGYQVDRNHTNCGLRTRILPILDYIKSMLSSNVVSISLASWKNSRESTSWSGIKESREEGEQVFRFTRSLAGDRRLRYEGAMAADRMAKELFTSDSWDWTPED